MDTLGSSPAQVEWCEPRMSSPFFLRGHANNKVCCILYNHNTHSCKLHKSSVLNLLSKLVFTLCNDNSVFIFPKFMNLFIWNYFLVETVRLNNPHILKYEFLASHCYYLTAHKLSVSSLFLKFWGFLFNDLQPNCCLSLQWECILNMIPVHYHSYQ